MEDDAKHDISRQLAALRQDGGVDVDAWHDLVPLVYDELHAIARRQLHRERDSHTLNSTALVHEAYLRLVKQRHAHWLDRAQFFAIAARVMRRILIDYARQHRAEKRGGRDVRVPIDSLDTREEIQARRGGRTRGALGLARRRAHLPRCDRRAAGARRGVPVLRRLERGGNGRGARRDGAHGAPRLGEGEGLASRSARRMSKVGCGTPSGGAKRRSEER